MIGSTVGARRTMLANLAGFAASQVGRINTLRNTITITRLVAFQARSRSAIQTTFAVAAAVNATNVAAANAISRAISSSPYRARSAARNGAGRSFIPAIRKMMA